MVFIPVPGESFPSKLQRVRKEMAKKNALAVAVTLLDEVAWLFNLRGGDIDFNPGECLRPSMEPWSLWG